jgi:Protein of unknown function (DUF3662)/Inner membrane component of T3SS, cytoplasmic domain
MGILRKVEHRVDAVVNGGFARLFKSEVIPADIASALRRECDEAAETRDRDHTVAPDDFIVELSAHDRELLGTDVQQFCEELAASIADHAHTQRYILENPVQVRLDTDASLGTGVLRVRGRRILATAEPQQDTDCWLELNGGPVTLPGPVTLLGRGPEADIHIDDIGVSRRHAQLSLGDPSVLLDLGSTNGFQVDGRYTRRAELHDGSVIVLGTTAIVYRHARESPAGHDTPGPAPPPR